MASVLKWVLLGSVIVFSPARAQERLNLLEGAALRENWQRIVELAGAATDLSPVERILTGHAELALNRNNDSLAHFLSVTATDELTGWRDWARTLRANNPGNAIACYFHGDALARQQEWQAAVAAFTAGLALAPGNALLLNARGVSFAATWDMNRAAVDLDAATKRNPQLADAFISLGSQWVQSRAASGAMNALKRALDLAPDSALAHSLRAGVEMVEERFPAAQKNVEQALSTAGPLHPAVQARLLDLAGLLRDRPAKEVELALATGENPGTLINRELQNLQLGKPGSVDRLMAMAQMFPDQRPAIASGIQKTATTTDSGLRSVNAGFSRLSQSEALASTVGTNSLPLGPTYAMSIGLSQQSRTSLSQASVSHPDFSSLAESFKNYGAFTGAFSDIFSGIKDMTKGAMSDQFNGAYRGFGVASHGLNVANAWLSGNSPDLREQLADSGLWGLGETARALHDVSSRLGSRWNVSEDFSKRMDLLDPLKNLVSASSSQIGNGRWLPNDTERSQYLNAAHDLLSFDFQTRFPAESTALKSLSAAGKLEWGGKLGVTAGLPDFADFISSRFQSGWGSPLTVNQSISLFDSFAKGTAYSAAFMASCLVRCNTDLASGVSALAGMAASAGRELTLPMFQSAIGANARAQLVDQWSRDREFGHTNLSFSQYVGGRDEASRLGFSRSDVSTLDSLFSSRPDPFTRPLSMHSFNLDPFRAIPGHTVTGTGAIGRSSSFDTASMAETTYQHYSYTDTFNGRTALQNVDRPSLPKPAEVSFSKPVSTPAPSPDYTKFFDSLRNSVNQSVGFGSGFNQPKPGGFTAGIGIPYWEDGEWPIRPWYGLGYIVNDRPAEVAREEKE
jgi:tetratricopeptide (TPR) repeat protein